MLYVQSSLRATITQ